METHWDRTWRRFNEAIEQKRRRDMNETRRDDTTRREPAADAVERKVMREVISEAMNKGADISHDMNSADYKTWEPFIDRYTDMALQAAIAAFEQALLSDEVVVAAGDVIAGEFYADLPMMTGEAYSQVAKAALQAAIAAVKGTEGSA